VGTESRMALKISIPTSRDDVLVSVRATIPAGRRFVRRNVAAYRPLAVEAKPALRATGVVAKNQTTSSPHARTPRVELGSPRVRLCAERAPGIALTGG